MIANLNKKDQDTVRHLGLFFINQRKLICFDRELNSIFVTTGRKIRRLVE